MGGTCSCRRRTSLASSGFLIAKVTSLQNRRSAEAELVDMLNLPPHVKISSFPQFQVKYHVLEQ